MSTLSKDQWYGVLMTWGVVRVNRYINDEEMEKVEINPCVQDVTSIIKAPSREIAQKKAEIMFGKVTKE